MTYQIDLSCHVNLTSHLLFILLFFVEVRYDLNIFWINGLKKFLYFALTLDVLKISNYPVLSPMFKELCHYD